MGNNEFKIFIETILDKVKSKTNINSDIKDLQKTVNKLKLGALLDSNSVKNITSQIQEIINQNVQLQNVDIDTSKLKQSSKQISKLLSQTQVDLKTEHAETSLKALTAKAQKLGVSLNFSNVNTALDAAKVNKTSESFQKVNLEVQKLRKDLTGLDMSNISKPITELQRLNLSAKMEKWLHENTAASKKFGAQVKDLISQCATLDGAEFYGLENQLKTIQNEAAAAGKLGKSLTDTLSSGMRKFSEWGMASRIVMGIVQSVKDMTTNVYKLDNSILELSKVSDLSANELENVTEKAYALGKTVAKTGTETLDAITNFKRSGYDIGDSFTYADEALKMANISENLKNTGNNAKSLVNIMKGFRDETPEFASHINDAINQVSNTEAVDFDNLVDGSTRLSAVAKQSGMSFEQMLGTLTASYEILGDMEKTASGQITIFTRLQAIQMDGEEEVSTVAKLQDTFSKATKGAVNIVDQTSGQLRNVYEILADLNSVWQTLDKNTQEALAFEAAGTRQKSVFLAMMSNWSGVEDAVKSATNSLGSSAEENQMYLDSLSGRTAQFQSAFEHLSKTVLDSDMLRFFVDLGTTGVSAIDSLVGALTPLGTIGVGGAIFGLIEFVKNFDWFCKKNYLKFA